MRQKVDIMRAQFYNRYRDGSVQEDFLSYARKNMYNDYGEQGQKFSETFYWVTMSSPNSVLALLRSEPNIIKGSLKALLQATEKLD